LITTLIITTIQMASSLAKQQQQQQLFAQISCEVIKQITPEFISSTKTEKGNTQISERIIIKTISTILDTMGISYQEAGSQQSKDFRNVGSIDLNIEVKKTDSLTIFFNDTCPCKDIFYVILFTGKQYKKSSVKTIPPQLLFLNGEEFINDSPWLEEYIREITALKEKYARGPNKKLLPGIMEVYPRPTFKANISKFMYRA
jgi:hypothetical protein